MAANLSSLSTLSSVTTTATALSNLVLVSPQNVIGYQPNYPAGNTASGAQPPALLFNYEGEQKVILKSDITDHYAEDNTAIQDQIALRPETITVHGFIGELNDIAPYGLQTAQAIASKLTIINAYTPVLSATALLAYNEAFQLYQVAANVTNTAISSWSSLTGQNGENVINSNGLGGSFNAFTGNVTGSQNKQQTAFQQFYGYWQARWLFTVQTPWAVFQNMAIESLTATQDAETNVISDFEITFKMIRFASTAASAGFQIGQGRFNQQSASLFGTGAQTATDNPNLGISSLISTSFPGGF